jgi:hypothetical protein
MASERVKKDEFQILEDRITASIQARGGTISLATNVEDLLTSIIAWCLSPNSEGKELEWPIDKHLSRHAIILKSFVLNEWGFRKKIDLLPKLVKAIDKACYKNNSELIKEINENLRKIGEFRNKLAHRPLNIWEAFDEPSVSDRDLDADGFQIVEYKKGKYEIRTIGFDEIKKEGKRANLTFLELCQFFCITQEMSRRSGFL